MTLWLILLMAVGAHGLAPIVETQEPLEDEYIVKLETSILTDLFHLELQNRSAVLQQQTGGEFGRYELVYTLEATPSVLIMKLDQMMLLKVRESLMVEYVEEDSLQEFDMDDEVVAIAEARGKTPANWGLDRINQVSNDLDGDVSYNGTYGKGVHIYVADSGVLDTHEDFEGRASRDFDVFDGNGEDDCKHGTGVAGIAASKTWGVAKNARIHSVKTLYIKKGVCKAKTSEMVKSIDWVTAHAETPCVVTMSFSSKTSSPTICDSVKTLAKKGCIPVTAACNVQNSNTDSCERSPAKCPYAITVAASRYPDDYIADISRFGICVDVFAPGEFVRTTAYDGGYWYQTGTSMATPFVAGVAAIHLGNGVPPEEVRKRIMDDASMCRVPKAGRGSPNRHLYIEPAQQKDVEN